MGERKKVLIMTNALSGGGVERVSATHLRLLLESDSFDIALAVCDNSVDMGIQYFKFRDFRESAIRKVLGSIGFALNRSTMKDCLAVFSPDIIHIHAYVQFGPAALAEILAYKKKTKCKVVLSHHTYSYICPNDALFNYRVWKPCEKCFDRRYSHIICDACYGTVPGSIGKYLQKKQYFRLFSTGIVDIHIASSNFMKEKLNAVYPELDIRIIYNPCLNRIAEVLPKKTHNKIVYFGRMSREKNVVSAVRAISGLPHMKLMLIGDGPEVEGIQREIKNASANHITLIDRFLPQQELYPMIEDAEYFILPSVCYESSSPVAAVEALNMGMVPLVSHHGGMKELVNLTHMGYCFDPDDIMSIQGAICTAEAEHTADMGKMLGLRGKLERFTEEKYLQDILFGYQNS